MMDRCVIPLTHVAVARLACFTELRLALANLIRTWGEVVRRREHRISSRSANPCFSENCLFALHPLRFTLSLADFEQSSTVDHIGTRDLSCSLKQPVPRFDVDFGKNRAVTNDLLEKLSCPGYSLRKSRRPRGDFVHFSI